MAATITEAAPSSWNPFRCGGTPLPPHLLLMAKMVILCLLVFEEGKHFKKPFLPFLPIFDSLGSFPYFPLGMKIIFFAGALLVMFNRLVRSGCLMVGGAVILGILAGRLEYRNHGVFVSFLLILTGLHQGDRDPWLIRLQVVLVYFGAGLNKILDPDWLNGQFFEYWTTVRMRHDLYTAISSVFPPLALSAVMSWTIIVAEFLLAIGFLIPRLYPLTIWSGILFHTGIMLFTLDPGNLDGLFGYFYMASLASFLAFARWPKSNIAVAYDPRIPFSAWVKSIGKWMDFDHTFRWNPLTQPFPQGFFGTYLAFEHQGKKVRNFTAIKKFLLFNPVIYLIILLGFLGIIRVLPDLAHSIWGSDKIPLGGYLKAGYVLGILIFFFPLFERLEESIINNILKRCMTKILKG